MFSVQGQGEPTPSISKLESRPPRQATLILVNNNVPCDELSFEQELTIGRHSSSDIQIQSKFISRHHAIVKRNENDQYVLHHLSSTNPSLVNGDAITAGERVLRDRDTLAFADKTFVFRAPPAPVPAPSPCVKLPPSSFAKHHPTLETIDEGTSCSMEDMSGKKSLDMPPPPPLSAEEIGGNQNKHSNSKSTSTLPLSLKEAIERRRKSAGTVVAPVSSLSANTVSPLKIQSKEVEEKATTPAAVRRSLSKEEMIQVSRQRMASPLRLQIQSRLKQSTTESDSGIEIKKFAPVKAVVAAESSPREKKRSLNTPLKNAIQRLRKSFGGHSLPQESSDVSAVTAPVHIPTAAVATDVAVTGESRTMSSALMKAIQARLKREEQLEQQQHSSPVTTSASITAAAVTPRVSTQQQRLQVPRAPEEAAMAEKRHGLPPALREAILGRRRKSLSAKEAPPMATGRKSLRKSLVPHPASELSVKNTPANKGAYQEVSEQTRPKALPTPIREGIQAARRLSLRQLVQVQATTPVAQPLASSKSTGKKSLRKLTAKKLRLGEEEDDMEEVHRSTTALISAAMKEDDGQLFAEDCLLAASVQISALAMVNELSDEHPLLSIGADDEEAAPEDGKSDDKGDRLPLFLDDAIVSILSPSHATRLSFNTDEQDESDKEEEEEEAIEGVALYLPSSAVKQSPRMSLTSASKTPVTSGVSSATKMASSVSRLLSMSAAADEEEDEDEAMDEVATQENDDDDEYGDDNDVDNEKFVEPASSSVRNRSQLLQSLEKKGRSRAQEENCEDAVIDWVSLLTEDDMHMLQSYVDQLLPSAAVILDGAGEVKSTDEESQELFALALDAYLRGMEFAHQLRHAPPVAAEMPTQQQQLQQKQSNQSSGETFSAPTNSMLMLPLTDLFKLPLDYIDASYADIDGDLVELYAQEIMAEAQVDESVAFGVALDAFLADPIEFRHRVGRLALPHLQPIHFLDEEGEEEEEYETQDEMVDVAEDDGEANVDAAEEEEKESVDVQPPEQLPTMGSVTVTPRHQRLSSEHIQLTSHKKGKQVHQEHARRISFLNNENSAVKAPAAHIDCQDETQQQQQLLEKLQSQLPVVASKYLLTSAAATPSSSVSSTIAADQTLGMVAAQVPLPPSTVKKSDRKSLARRASQQLADVGTEESVELHNREEAEEPVSKKLRYSMAHEAASVPLPPSTVKQQPVSRRSSSRARDLVASTPIANVALTLEAAEVPLPPSTVKKSVKKSEATSVERASPSQFLADEAARVPLPPSTVKKSVKKSEATSVERASPSQFLADEAARVSLPPSTIKKSKQVSHRQSLQTPNKRVGQEAAQVPLPPSTGKKASTPGAAAGAPEEMDTDGEEDDGDDAHDDSEDPSHRASILSNPPSETSTSMIDIPINFKHEDAEEDRVEEEEHQPSAPAPLATAPTETTMEDVEPEEEMIVAPVKKGKKSVASTATRGKKSTVKKDIPAEEEVFATAVEVPERTVTVEEVPPSKPALAPAPAVGRGRGRKTVEVVEEPEPVVVETSASSFSSSSSSSNVPEPEKVSGKKRGRSTTVPGMVKEEPVAVVLEQPEEAVVKPVVTKRGGRVAKNVTTTEAAAEAVPIESVKEDEPVPAPSKKRGGGMNKATGSKKVVAVEEEEEGDDDDDMEEVTIILCDGCDDEYVLQDMGMSKIPKGDWFCARCVSTKKTAAARGKKAAVVVDEAPPSVGKSAGKKRSAKELQADVVKEEGVVKEESSSSSSSSKKRAKKVEEPATRSTRSRK